MADERWDAAYLRLYGIDPDQVASTVNDGPRVLQGVTPPRAPGVGADRPSDPQVWEPELTLHQDGFTMSWHPELGTLLASRLRPREVEQMVKALAARLCMDAWQVAHRVSQVEKQYRLARERTLRAR